MPQGGNFGGASIPDVIVGGKELMAGSATTYVDYTCTQAISTGNSATYEYTTDPGTGGLNITIAVGSAGALGPEMVIVPQQVLATTNVAFLCYSCDCDQAMSGTTALGDTGYGGSLTGGTKSKTWQRNTLPPSLAPVIIGGEGLNN